MAVTIAAPTDQEQFKLTLSKVGDSQGSRSRCMPFMNAIMTNATAAAKRATPTTSGWYDELRWLYVKRECLEIMLGKRSQEYDFTRPNYAPKPGARADKLEKRWASNEDRITALIEEINAFGGLLVDVLDVQAPIESPVSRWFADANDRKYSGDPNTRYLPVQLP